MVVVDPAIGYFKIRLNHIFLQIGVVSKYRYKSPIGSSTVDGHIAEQNNYLSEVGVLSSHF